MLSSEPTGRSAHVTLLMCCIAVGPEHGPDLVKVVVLGNGVLKWSGSGRSARFIIDVLYCCLSGACDPV